MVRSDGVESGCLVIKIVTSEAVLVNEPEAGSPDGQAVRLERRRAAHGGGMVGHLVGHVESVIHLMKDLDLRANLHGVPNNRKRNGVKGPARSQWLGSL